MDPTACLRRIEEAPRASYSECREACADLQAWLALGGFAPHWALYPIGTRRFKRWQKRNAQRCTRDMREDL